MPGEIAQAGPGGKAYNRVAVPITKEITGLLVQLRSGHREVAGRLMELVYPELRRLAAHYMRLERGNHTLQATALVHEAYLKIFGSEPVDWQNRAHFFAVAAQQMRRILVDHARAREADKRGGGRIRLSIEDVKGLTKKRDQDVVALDEVLQRLEKLDPRAGRAVELRFFGGLSEKEAAEVLGISVATLKRDWEFARAWLFEALAS